MCMIKKNCNSFSYLALVTVLAFAMSFGFVGCKHNPANNANSLTSFQKVVQWNTAIAQANQDVAQLVINAQKSGSISQADATTILEAQEQIAKSDEQLTNILASGPDAVNGNKVAVQAIVTNIQALTQNLLSTASVKNAGTIGTEVGLVLNSATSILDVLAQTGVLK